MPYPVHRQFIATIAAVAIAITGFSAVPARAGNDDLGKALAALAGLAVLGVVIKNARDDDKRQSHPPRNDVYGHGYGSGRDDFDGVRPRPLPHRANQKLLPQQCLRSVNSWEGRQRVFGQRCLERNYNFTQRLPRECLRRFQTDRGRGIGYEARCLSHYGYELARR